MDTCDWSVLLWLTGKRLCPSHRKPRMTLESGGFELAISWFLFILLASVLMSITPCSTFLHWKIIHMWDVHCLDIHCLDWVQLIFFLLRAILPRYIRSHYGTDGSLSITAHTPCLLASLHKTLPTSYCTFSTANIPCPFYCLPLTFPKPNTSHPCHLLFLTLTLPTLDMPHPDIPHLLPFLPLTIHATNIYDIPSPFLL